MDERQPARMNLHRLSRAQARYESGMEYVRRGRHESAARSFTRAIRLDRDNNAQYRYMRGLVYFHLGRYDSAISDFRDAIARDTAHAKVHTCLGGAYQWSLSTVAVECYEQAISIDPGYEEARAGLEAIRAFLDNRSEEAGEVGPPEK